MHSSSPQQLSRRRLVGGALGTGTVAAILASVPESISATAVTPTDAPLTTMGTAGDLISWVQLGEQNRQDVIDQLDAVGLASSGVRFGVRTHLILYVTPDPAGQPTIGSALVVLPVGGDADLSLVSWLHGTTIYRGDAGTISATGPDRIIAMAFAAAGYAVSAPDYLGLGPGPGFHTYDHLPSTVTASIDALRATRTMAEAIGQGLDGRVLVSGFSQGGPATMAAGRALQDAADPDLRLSALAPISGPYDFGWTFKAAISGEIASAPQYLAYLVVAWNRLHHLYEAPADAFLAPYAAGVESLLDGHHTDDEVFAGITAESPDQLFTPVFLEALRAPSGALAAAIAVADASCDWQPLVPVTIYAASGDRDVPIHNAAYALERLGAHGTTAEVIDVGDVDHSTSVVVSVPRVLAWFAELDGAR